MGLRVSMEGTKHFLAPAAERVGDVELLPALRLSASLPGSSLPLGSTQRPRLEAWPQLGGAGLRRPRRVEPRRRENRPPNWGRDGLQPPSSAVNKPFVQT